MHLMDTLQDTTSFGTASAVPSFVVIPTGPVPDRGCPR